MDINMGLPVAEEVRWEGWAEDEEWEADIWVEHRALARGGGRRYGGGSGGGCVGRS